MRVSQLRLTLSGSSASVLPRLQNPQRAGALDGDVQGGIHAYVNRDVGGSGGIEAAGADRQRGRAAHAAAEEDGAARLASNRLRTNYSGNASASSAPKARHERAL